MSTDRIEMPDTGDPRYQSYLLRLWQEAPGDEHRALLQDVLSGESRSFPSLERLFTYLGRSREQPEETRTSDGPDELRSKTTHNSRTKGGSV